MSRYSLSVLISARQQQWFGPALCKQTLSLLSLQPCHDHLAGPDPTQPSSQPSLSLTSTEVLASLPLELHSVPEQPSSMPSENPSMTAQSSQLSMNPIVTSLQLSNPPHTINTRTKPINSDALPNFLANSTAHFALNLTQEVVENLTSRRPPLFTRQQYDEVTDTIKQIKALIALKAQSGNIDDELKQLEKLYNGGIISWEQNQAVKASIR